MLNPQKIRLIKQVLPVGFIWFVSSMAFLWTEYAIIESIADTPITAIAIDFEIYLFASISVFFIGLLVGFIELTVINKWFRHYGFIRKTVTKMIFYLVLMECLILILFPLAASIELDTSFLSSQVWGKYGLFFFSITHLSTIIQIGFSLLISVLYLEIADHLGHSVLRNFFTGKYHRPKVEQRIFLFSDMKSSTTIAEKMGHVRYFELLRAYYNELSGAIINAHGEVYQYIGDEIVITWDVNDSHNYNQAVECFFNMKKSLLKKKSYYEETFDFFPDFKAAIHVGEVTTGEIGALKKEIFFTGDVLNTTSRIQSLCKEYNTDLLVSKGFLDNVNNPELSTLFELGGTNELKGKKETVSLFRIKEQ